MLLATLNPRCRKQPIYCLKWTCEAVNQCPQVLPAWVWCRSSLAWWCWLISMPCRNLVSAGPSGEWGCPGGCSMHKCPGMLQNSHPHDLQKWTALRGMRGDETALETDRQTEWTKWDGYWKIGTTKTKVVKFHFLNKMKEQTRFNYFFCQLAVPQTVVISFSMLSLILTP